MESVDNIPEGYNEAYDECLNKGSREVYRGVFSWFLGQDVGSGYLGVLAVLGWDGVREVGRFIQAVS
eukprot:snap_masked-scaffold_3-processed-gene-6.14-mRNA-1 protein AED:1.00 eAED:1.00 QI:0/0/0/0/1/1/2/0/66